MLISFNKIRGKAKLSTKNVNSVLIGVNLFLMIFR